MDYSITDLLSLVGSLALFLYGMKMMSEALQKVAGARMKNILSSITSNRFLGLLTGVLVTAVVQSSSATTVMVVSFVNAGLITLRESISVIIGTNIGSTVTSWLISILGFETDLKALVLPAIGIAMPMIFSQNNKLHSIGELIAGLALLFMGLDFLTQNVPQFSGNEPELAFLHEYTDQGFLSMFIFLLVGTILTLIVQSSAASMALVFALCVNGVISFEIAAAMVLGSNIGTTVTANIAAAVGNVSARRAAMAHLMFNVLGTIWVIPVFYPLLSLVNTLTIDIMGVSPYEESGMTSIPLALSIFHTIFNSINALIFIWIPDVLEKMVMKILPTKPDEEEEFHLQFITTGMLSTSELSLIQAKKEISHYAKHTKKMFGFIEKMLNEDISDSKFVKTYAKVEKYESTCDSVEIEIANYLTKINQGKLSDVGRRKARAMLRVVNELESVGDSNYTMARMLNRMRSNNFKYSDKMSEKINLMFSMLDEALSIMRDNLRNSDYNADLASAKEIESRINVYRDQLKAENFENIKNGKYSYETSVYFIDLIQECERMGDYIINVSEAINDVNNE